MSRPQPLGAPLATGRTHRALGRSARGWDDREGRATRSHPQRSLEMGEPPEPSRSNESSHVAAPGSSCHLWLASVPMLLRCRCPSAGERRPSSDRMTPRSSPCSARTRLQAGLRDARRGTRGDPCEQRCAARPSRGRRIWTRGAGVERRGGAGLGARWCGGRWRCSGPHVPGRSRRTRTPDFSLSSGPFGQNIPGHASPAVAASYAEVLFAEVAGEYEFCVDAPGAARLIIEGFELASSAAGTGQGCGVVGLAPGISRRGGLRHPGQR